MSGCGRIMDKAEAVIRGPGKTLALLDQFLDQQQRQAREAMIDETITELTELVGTKAACRAVGRSRATHYRRHRQSPAPPRQRRGRPGSRGP